MGGFLLRWLPLLFFFWYLSVTIYGDLCPNPNIIVAILLWIGKFTSVHCKDIQLALVTLTTINFLSTNFTNINQLRISDDKLRLMGPSLLVHIAAFHCASQY